MIVILTFYWQKFLSFRASAKNHLKKVLLCQKYYQNHYYNYLLILNSLAVPWSSIKSSVRIPLHKKWSFLLTISSVNVTKSTVSWRNLKNLLKKSLMENFFLCSVLSEEYSVTSQTSKIEHFAKRFSVVSYFCICLTGFWIRTCL